MAIPSSDKKYSYADYLIWSEGKRIELIDGQVYSSFNGCWVQTARNIYKR